MRLHDGVRKAWRYPGADHSGAAFLIGHLNIASIREADGRAKNAHRFCHGVVALTVQLLHAGADFREKNLNMFSTLERRGGASRCNTSRVAKRKLLEGSTVARDLHRSSRSKRQGSDAANLIHEIGQDARRPCLVKNTL